MATQQEQHAWLPVSRAGTGDNEALKVTGLGGGQRQENGGINLREVTAQIQGGHQLLECSIWEFRT